ncbi:MAG: NifB/NifX family molybdenum-iron cluster-binding protein [Ignavibacteriae bacterium]|nr:NifB/NifX family molybdenum-iron cluster-binding protein [Ignavibacteriota bacterium]
MKVAIPSNGGIVEDHFGHSEYFTVYTINENNEPVNEEIIASAHGCGCKSNIVETLFNMGVQTMLAGNMGDGAVNKLNSFGIEVIRGCSGEVSVVVNDWLKGNLKDSEETCNHHNHDDGTCNH